MVYLNSLLEEYAGRGLRVVAITMDDPDELRSKVIEGMGAKFWIGVDRILTIVRFVQRQGDASEFSFPKRYLVDTEGRIVGYGKNLEATIEKLLEGVFDPALKDDLHRELASARRCYETGAVGRAWRAAKRKEEDGDPAVARDAKYIREHCEAHARWMRWRHESLAEEKDYPALCAFLEEVRRDFAPMDVAGWARQRLRELKADRTVRLELTAWAKLEKVIEKERRAEGEPRKLAAVRELYASIIEKYPGTRAAAEARTRLRR